MRFARGALLSVLALSLASCALSGEELRQKSTRFAEKAQMKPVEIAADPFTLQAYERITNQQAPVRVFIEGDGKAWLTRNQPSPNPTPYEPTALMLAGSDTSPNVAYLARPCQFITGPACLMPVWTSRQYGEQNIAAMNKALDRWRGHKLELVGYSGGATIALLLAARRDDVINIRTVAGNTDTLAFTTFHHVSPPPADTLNPASFTARTATIPQIHFVGENDRIVPPSFAEAYQAKLPPGNCSKVITIANTSHTDGWPEHWQRMADRALPCVAPKSYYQ